MNLSIIDGIGSLGLIDNKTEHNQSSCRDGQKPQRCLKHAIKITVFMHKHV